MAREKAPAFQFYPKDWDTDLNVKPMTYEEEGVYFALIRLLWHHPKVTSDLHELRLLLKGKPRLSLMQKWWRTIGKCFSDHDGVLFHKRVAHERRKQDAYRKSQSQKGKRGGRPKAAVKPELSSGKALLSSSSSSSASADQEETPPKSPASAWDLAPTVFAMVKKKDITRKERAVAEGVIDEFGCPHAHPEARPPVPECESRHCCIGRIVGDHRSLERSGLHTGVA